MLRFAVIALVVIPSICSAATVERFIRLGQGSSTTLHAGQPVRLHIDDPEIASAQLSETYEVRIEALSEGSTLVFLHGEHGTNAWRVLVDQRSDPDARRNATEEARRACGDLEEEGEGVVIRVHSAQCRDAVLAISDHLSSGELSLRFNELGIRAQLEAQQARLTQDHPDLVADLLLGYLGATLMIRGSVPSQEAADAVVRSLWRATAGRLLIDTGRLRIGPAPARGR